ncbi:MAG: U32 family peptidase [Sedimentisphaerales bacterium]|nr:U32 family peptidase [Sedimentisphaerales bacterium]
MTPELLAPAGTLEKLQWAVAYGADAVYFGCEFGSLRSYAGNLTFSEAKTGLQILHDHGRKGYVALNIYPFTEEYPQLVETAKTLDAMGANAFIISDLGVLRTLSQLDLNAAIHISTQANTVSAQTVATYRELGAARINLARELSLGQIGQIAAETAGSVELEVFIHGAVCFSYSGRCAISDYLTGQRANRGECKHPCRWSYALVEEKRPGEYFPVFEDQRGSYLFNSRELALFEYIPRLAELGIRSFKIEGRMKSVYYLASIVSFYRQILDGRHFSREEAFGLLNRVSNRGYSTGFLKGKITEDDYATQQSRSQGHAVFVGDVLPEKIDNKTVVRVRNTIRASDELELLTPGGTLTRIVMPPVFATPQGQATDTMNHSQFFLIEADLPAYSILRRIITETEKDETA